MRSGLCSDVCSSRVRVWVCTPVYGVTEWVILKDAGTTGQTTGQFRPEVGRRAAFMCPVVVLKDARTTGQTTGQSDGDGDSDTTGHRQDDGTRRRDSVICCRACDGTDAGTDRRTQRQTSCVVISEKSQDVVTHAGTDLRRWGRLRERRRVVISERPSTVDPAVAEGPRDARAS